MTGTKDTAQVLQDLRQKEAETQLRAWNNRVDVGELVTFLHPVPARGPIRPRVEGVVESIAWLSYGSPLLRPGRPRVVVRTTGWHAPLDVGGMTTHGRCPIFARLTSLLPEQVEDLLVRNGWGSEQDGDSLRFEHPLVPDERLFLPRDGGHLMPSHVGHRDALAACARVAGALRQVWQAGRTAEATIHALTGMRP